MSGTVPAVDVHAHVAVPAVEALIVGEPGYAEQQRTDAAALGDASIACNRAHFVEVIPRLTDLDLRLAAMDKGGVDIQAVSPVGTIALHHPDLAVEQLRHAVTACCGRPSSTRSSARPGSCATWFP